MCRKRLESIEIQDVFLEIFINSHADDEDFYQVSKFSFLTSLHDCKYRPEICRILSKEAPFDSLCSVLVFQLTVATKTIYTNVESFCGDILRHKGWK